MPPPITNPHKRNKTFNDNWKPTTTPNNDDDDDDEVVFVITGAASGLGNVIVKRLSEMMRGRKGRFFLVGRNVDAGLRTIGGLRRGDEEYHLQGTREEGGEGWIKEDRYTFIACDVSLMSNVHSLSSSIREKTDRVNYLVHSAGTSSVASKPHPTKEGIESLELANRYYARFALTFDLLELLRKGGGGGGGVEAGVMSILGTGIPFWNKIDLDDLGFHKSFWGPRVMFHSGVYNDLWITVSPPPPLF